MDKAKLKTLIPSLTAGDRFTIAFVGDRREDSGTFEVVRTRVGRGKGGSQLVDYRNTDGEMFITGTPQNEMILHIITPDGVMHGFENETDIPPVFETDNVGHIQGDRDCPCRACTLKRSMGTLVDGLLLGSRIVRIESTYAPFTGTFTVVNAVQLRGRYGQVIVTLEMPGTTETFELWSFRHSGVITSFEMVDDFAF